MGWMSSAESTVDQAGVARAGGWCRAAIIGLALALLSAPAGAESEPQFFRIGTGAVDSPSFAVGGLIAAGLSNPPGTRPCDRGGSCGVPGMIALAQALGSAAEAIDLLETRQIDAIVVPAGDAQAALTAKHPEPPKGAPPAKPREPLRTVGTLFIEAVHVAVREGTRYETIDDLKRRLVATASDDPTAAPFAQLVAGQFGFEAARKAPMLPVAAALQKLAESRVEALVIVEPVPAPALVELTRTTPIRLLVVPALKPAPPYLAEVKLPAGTYGNSEALDLPGQPIQLYVAAGADPDRVEAITRALWNDATLKLLSAGPPAARAVKLERALAGVAVPLHPGAARVYREAGILNNAPVGQ